MNGYRDPVSFYIDKLCEGIATIAAAFAPEPVIVRMSDFKSNEYANLIGGRQYEPHEENPMIGFRGASRYVDETFRPCFELECRALKRVREEMGLKNVQVMVPFVRTREGSRAGHAAAGAERPEARRERSEGHHDVRAADQRAARRPVSAVLRRHVDRLERHDAADARPGSRLGDRRKLFDERDEAVKALLKMAIDALSPATASTVGICGQGPSDHPDLARWLVEQGIESISLNPDTVVETWLFLAGGSVAEVNV